MKRIAVLLALTAAALCPAAFAQASAPSVPAAPVCPSSATLDELIKAVDEAVSGPANKDRTCFRDLFTADARLAPMVKSADGSFAPRMLTVQGWIDAVAKRGSAVFYERQVKVKSEVYGHIAHLWSTYETRSTPDGKAEVRGINSIQAVNDGTRWRVVEIVWQAETPDTPVPAQYLP
jgi:hypothetical protein